VALLNVDIMDLKGLNKQDARTTFETWAKNHIPNASMLSFEGGKEVIAGRERSWRVVSFGDYKDASGHARRFVSYRCGFGTLSRVYSWIWDDVNSRWMPCEVQGFGSW